MTNSQDIFNNNILLTAIALQFIAEGGREKYGNMAEQAMNDYPNYLRALNPENKEAYIELIDESGNLNSKGRNTAHKVLTTREPSRDFEKMAGSSFGAACAMMFIAQQELEKFIDNDFLTDKAGNPLPMSDKLRESMTELRDFCDGMLAGH